jgi:hypothetical protein
MDIFVTNGCFDNCFKTAQNPAYHVKKLEEEDPIDLLSKMYNSGISLGN